jgi:hypothetical protein
MTMTQDNDAVAVARRPSGGGLERYVAGVRYVAPVMPAIASAVMFIVYLLPPPVGLDAPKAVLLGLVAAAIVALVGGAVAIPFNRGRDRSRSFLELWERYQRLDARLEVAKGGDKHFPTADERAAAELAISDIERIVARLKRSLEGQAGRDGAGGDPTQPPGSEDWSTSGAGYVGLWQLIHAAEEALILVEPMTEVIAQALTDRRRLIGSTIAQAPALLAMQGAAVRGLDPAIAETYFAATAESLTGAPGK